MKVSNIHPKDISCSFDFSTNVINDNPSVELTAMYTRITDLPWLHGCQNRVVLADNRPIHRSFGSQNQRSGG